MPIFDALVDSKIKLILVRHEQGATHMADGYARATGKPGVVLVTSGPGATNTVTGLLTALMDSVPMIVLTGQTISPMLGKDAFQEADVTGITYPVVKHCYLVKNAADIPRIDAARRSTSRRPAGPGPCSSTCRRTSRSGPCTAAVRRRRSTCPATTVPGQRRPGAAQEGGGAARQEPKKPVLYVGHGAVISGAGKAIMQLAEKLQAPIVNTLLGKGACPEDHPLHQGMLGMHGTAYANKTVTNCDLHHGHRRALGRPHHRQAVASSAWARRKIHVDIDVAEFNKIVRPDVSPRRRRAPGDRGPAAAGRQARHADWLKEIAALAQAVPAQVPQEGRPARAARARPAGQAGRARLHHHHRRRPAPDVGGAVLPAPPRTATGCRRAAPAPWASASRRRSARQFAQPARRSGRSSATAASR